MYPTSYKQMLIEKSDLKKQGFTLIEILVVVLIIGVLGAIALPQYQRAVLKSRYSGMMPIAKALAEANEVYFVEHGEYSENPADLLVAGRDKNAGAYPDGTRVFMYDEDGLSYVRVMNDNVPNARYLVYQKHSTNFPDTTQCEAADDRANELCVALGGQIIEEGNSSGEAGWTAYVLSGNYDSGDQLIPAGENNSGEGGDEPGAGDEPGENPGTNTDPQTPTDPNAPCQAGDTPPANITANKSGATGTASCVNGHWKYEWTGGTNYEERNEVCRANEEDSDYACAGATFSGESTDCVARTENGCADSIFSGPKARCLGWAENGCTGSTLSGDQVFCDAEAPKGCAGVIVLAGAYCVPYPNTDGCEGVLYGTNPNHTGTGASLLGSCSDYYGGCPTGVPIVTGGQYAWNSSTHAYSYTWKGGYCDPNAMVTGKCPAGTHSADANGQLDGQCWDGDGNRVACE